MNHQANEKIGSKFKCPLLNERSHSRRLQNCVNPTAWQLGKDKIMKSENRSKAVNTSENRENWKCTGYSPPNSEVTMCTIMMNTCSHTSVKNQQDVQHVGR